MKVLKYITPPEWMGQPETQEVMRALGGNEAPPKALFVGGAVRNALFGDPVLDIDIATVLRPEEVMDRLKLANIKALPTGIDHGTITAVLNRKPFEITSLRKDVETDGRRAVVAFTEDWQEDAQRRDFTINALFAGPDGAVYDPTGRGLEDLEARRVVFVGAPDQRIAEDYLRILRFFRFYAWYGKGLPDEAALAACRRAADKILTLSKERITHEVLKILAVTDPTEVLSLMFENKILEALFSEGYHPESLSDLCALQARYHAPDIMARLFVLDGLRGKDVSSFLVLSNAQKKTLRAYEDAFSGLDEISEKTVKELVYKYKNDIALQVLFFKEAPEDLRTLAQNWQGPKFPLTGQDLLKAGMSTGPDLGKKLSEIESWWVDQRFEPDKAACLKKLGG